MIKHIHHKLLKKCKRGNSKAQFEIYELYYKGMYNVSFRMLQNSAEAEDVMQDAFLSAFNKLDTWQEEVTFGAWLKRIVVNKSLDYIKKRKMQFIEVDDRLQIRDELYNDDNEEINTFKVELVKEAINKLPEKYRLITIMFLIEGYTHNEIADFLDIKSETSRVRFLRAKKMILKSGTLKDKLQSISLN